MEVEEEGRGKYCERLRDVIDGDYVFFFPEHFCFQEQRVLQASVLSGSCSVFFQGGELGVKGVKQDYPFYN